MFNPTSSIRVFVVFELLGLVAIVTGLIIVVGAPITGEWVLMPYGIALALSALSMLAVAHIGRCLVHIASTASKILEKIEKQPAD